MQNSKLLSRRWREQVQYPHVFWGKTWPGSQGALLPPSPLRTVRMNFSIHGSSPSKARETRTRQRWRYVALTICACSLWTLRWAWDQSISCHITALLENAHARVLMPAFICFFSFWGSTSFLVKKDLSEVCSLSGRVMLAYTATRIHPITGWHSLFPTSSARTSISIPCGLPADILAKIRVYHVPYRWQDRLGSDCSPVVFDPCASKLEGGNFTTSPFWLWLISIFSHFTLTRFIIGSLLLAILPSPAPNPCDAHRLQFSSRFTAPFGRVHLSRWLRTTSLPKMHAPIGYCWRNSRSYIFPDNQRYSFMSHPVICIPAPRNS